MKACRSTYQYKYINGKDEEQRDHRQDRKGGKIHQALKDLSEIMNRSLKFVFTIDDNSTERNMPVAHGELPRQIVGEFGCKEGDAHYEKTS